MIEQEATVVRIQGAFALISVAQQSTCGSCVAKSGCGTSVVARLFPQRQQHIQVPNTVAAKAGDRVVIGLPEAGLQRASLLLYGTPLLGLLFGGAAGEYWGGSEPQAILGGLLGILVGLGYVHWRSTRSVALKPVLLRRQPSAGVSVSSLHVGPV